MASALHKARHRTKVQVPGHGSGLAKSGLPTSTAAKSRKDKTYSEFKNPMMIHFDDDEAVERGLSENRPRKLYRYHSEDAATLSVHVNKINHIHHNEVKDLKLKQDNAFQSIGTLKPNVHITKEFIHRHYSSRKKKNPSPFISIMSSHKDSEEILRRIHKTRTTPPRRMFVAEIDLSKFIPATLKGTISTTPQGHNPDKKEIMKTATTDRYVEVPIWVLDSVQHEGNPATRPCSEINYYLNSGGLIWLSVDELTRSDLELWAMTSHEHEWLAASQIPETLVTKVMPFDGSILHTGISHEVVRSRLTSEAYLWNFDIKMWVLDPDLEEDHRPYRLANIGDKRRADSITASDSENSDSDSDAGDGFAED